MNFKKFVLVIFTFFLLVPFPYTFSARSTTNLDQKVSQVTNSIKIDQNSDRTNFSKFIVITWDGTRAKWLEEYSSSDVLSVTNILREEGSEVYLKLLDQPSSTDPCLAVIESGFGPKENKILANTFGAGPDGPRIPEGYQTSERFKSFFGSSYKTGHLNSWAYDYMNQSYYGLPDGFIAQSDSTDTIFFNAKPGVDVDFWFGSENITWKPENPEAHQASLDEYWRGTYINGTGTEGLLSPNDPESYRSYGYIERFSETYDKYIKYWLNPLINAKYLAKQAITFLDEYGSDNFYLRIHMTEPDYWGHKYGESTDNSFNKIAPEYLKALIECDNATGDIITKLKECNIYNDTFVLVGSDHGFLGSSHSEEPILYVSNQKIWRNSGDDTISKAYGLEHDIQPTLLALAGVDWESIGYRNSKPVFLREYGSALESTVPTTTTTKTTATGNSTRVPFEVLVLGLFYLLWFKRKKEINPR